MPWTFFDNKGNRKETTSSAMMNPMAKVIMTSSTGALSTAGNVLFSSWQAADYDTSSFWSAGTPSRFTIPSGAGGRYRVGAAFRFNAQGTNYTSQIKLVLNGTTVLTSSAAGAGTTVYSGRRSEVLSWTGTLNAGDYIEIYYSLSGATAAVIGGDTSLAGGGDGTTHFEIAKIDGAIPTTLYMPASGSQSLICSSVLGSAQATFDTNTILGGNIPGIYNHLQAFIVARGDTAAASTAIYGRFNNDSGTNYLLENLVGKTTTPSAGNNAAANVMQLHDQIPAASDTANRPGCVEWFIPCYAQTTFHKATISKGYGIGQQAVEITGNAWANTAAINRIQILLGAGNLTAGSAFYLYGVA